jgi:hypothetical protein
MVAFLGIFLAADAIVILSANFQYVTAAAHVCEAAAPLCRYPVPMFILGVIASGLMVIQP